MQSSRLKLTNPVHFAACGFGSGLIPVAPGTWGTVVGMLLWWGLSILPWLVYCIVLLVTIFTGAWLCGKTAKDLQVHDHPAIVWDEFCGYWLTMLFVPRSFFWALYGFILFRIFDIWKPFPIRYIDKHMAGGWGIMTDDLIAGLFSVVLLQLTRLIINISVVT
ncbi:MAG: phosphatidylglycerophosphatase A [Endozoicomonadaceae bacterium]|nr:phosphatidylglycerophosphatase A [Endozoicomonadaceae bacterium]MCY4328883.1 phosphatidylglycerophosphatase A [Endozoicomonadaceae bacterium]